MVRLLQCASSQAAREYIRVPHFVGVMFCYCYFFVVQHFCDPLIFAYRFRQGLDNAVLLPSSLACKLHLSKGLGLICNNFVYSYFLNSPNLKPFSITEPVRRSVYCLKLIGFSDKLLLTDSVGYPKFIEYHYSHPQVAQARCLASP